MEKIYNKYNVKNYQELLQHFEMITLAPIEDLEIDDEVLYHSFALVLERARESKYNPIEESIMLKTTFLAAFYGVPYEDFSEMIKEIGSFRTHLFLQEVLEENYFYKEYYSLFLKNLERLNNLGIVIVDEGKEILAKVEEFLSNMSVEKLQDLMGAFKEKVEELGILEEN